MTEQVPSHRCLSSSEVYLYYAVAGQTGHPKAPVDRVSRLSTAHHILSVYFTMKPDMSPAKLPLPLGGSGSPPNAWFLGPGRVHNPNGIAIPSAVSLKHLTPK